MNQSREPPTPLNSFLLNLKHFLKSDSGDNPSAQNSLLRKVLRDQESQVFSRSLFWAAYCRTHDQLSGEGHKFGVQLGIFHSGNQLIHRFADHAADRLTDRG